MERVAFLDEFEKLVIGMNTPRVVVDNAVCPSATIVKVDSSKKQRLLMEAVQHLADLDLSIRKAYFSSDSSWFMDVFYVTDKHGRKLAGDHIVSYMERSLVNSTNIFESIEEEEEEEEERLTVLELSGADRPGLLSEIFAVLADFDCRVVDTKVWTHNRRMVSVILLKIAPAMISVIESRIRQLLSGARTAAWPLVSTVKIHPDRRLHQMMFENCDFDHEKLAGSSTSVSVESWVEHGYTAVMIHCQDRPKLLFDIVCALTEMEYVVFHGTVDTFGDQTYQEFFIRQTDGSLVSSEEERSRVVRCLQAAIECRAYKGLRVELCTSDHPRLLAGVTQTFRENGLSVTQAETSTKGEMTEAVFYLTDSNGGRPEPRLLDALRENIGDGIQRITVEQPLRKHQQPSAAAVSESSVGGGRLTGLGLFVLGSLLMRNLYNSVG